MYRKVFESEDDLDSCSFYVEEGRRVPDNNPVDELKVISAEPIPQISHLYAV